MKTHRLQPVDTIIPITHCGKILTHLMRWVPSYGSWRKVDCKSCLKKKRKRRESGRMRTYAKKI